MFEFQSLFADTWIASRKMELHLSSVLKQMHSTWLGVASGKESHWAADWICRNKAKTFLEDRDFFSTVWDLRRANRNHLALLRSRRP